jgi:hypothetical protein
MRSITPPGYPADARPTEENPAPGRPVRGRWFWGLSGIVTLALLGIPVGYLIVRAGIPEVAAMPQSAVPTRTITVLQPVTSLDLESYGAPIVVTAGPVHHVQVTEAITFSGPVSSGPGGGPPAVTQSVSRGRLTLNAPECNYYNCSVGFTVTVPADVAVTAQSDNGSINVSGVAAANLDSGGGPVRVSDISGQLTVNTENGSLTVDDVAGADLDSGGGPVQVADVNGPLTVNTENGNLTMGGTTGPLDVDTGGGDLLARDVTTVTATISTENGNADIAFNGAPQLVSVDTGGGDARIGFGAAPQSVSVSTQGGNALVTVPGGPYALTVDSEGGSQQVGIGNDPTAHRSITVDSGGGDLVIVP